MDLICGLKRRKLCGNELVSVDNMMSLSVWISLWIEEFTSVHFIYDLNPSAFNETSIGFKRKTDQSVPPSIRTGVRRSRGSPTTTQASSSRKRSRKRGPREANRPRATMGSQKDLGPLLAHNRMSSNSLTARPRHLTGTNVCHSHASDDQRNTSCACARTDSVTRPCPQVREQRQHTIGRRATARQPNPDI